MIPGEVAEVRKRYELRRDEFAAKTRLGEASLARWESGQLIQNAAYDNYLYLLTFEENMKRLEERSVNVVSHGEIRAESSDEEVVEIVRSERAEVSQSRFRALGNPERVRSEACGFRLRRRARAS
jgi:transcriptional regulator with XRE-family HTH domain